MTPERKDIYATVTDSIIAMLEAGVRPWSPQWSSEGCGAPAIPRPFHPRRDPSLAEFLSVRGLCDDGGELSARDLDRWHREAPFRRKLVRADGVSLERAAMSAWEAGYFPDAPVPAWDSSDNMTPVSEAMLLDALERELRADYAHVWGAHDEAFFAEAGGSPGYVC